MKRQKVIITAAVVGTAHMASMSPYFPVKPEDIIQQAVDACAAGAASFISTAGIGRQGSLPLISA